ncbi:type I restriction enzyme S subunit [Methanohalophilus levihalophilus]|uniref:restriction endonuclease subunit S n=1 Tax=Methanohalophilus levihalophilus TaxID=1431282 RepID=UPI001AE40558|nr:restriction endonuclease subunit S [Methanohalophilus levihalophilus]MBP2030666.1 type I restriction enzyme S subunit [Methanohalophilus levihalophilus]
MKDTDEFLTKEGAKKSVYLEKGTFVLSNSATIGVPTILGINGCIHDGYLAFPYLNKNQISIKYLYYFFLYFQGELKKRAFGGAQLNLNTGIVKNIAFPLPPFEEQKRIVAKVDQLMAVCDQLESLQQKKNENRNHLNNSALSKMLAAASPEEFAEHWQFVYGNFDLLYEDLDNLKKLRQTILQLAVQGKLVEQDASDEPAEVLLERIKAEKDRLMKGGKIKKTSKSLEIDESKTPYEISDKWKWVRLIDLCDVGTGSTPLKTQAEYYENGTIPWITSSATSLEFVDNAETHITQKAVEECRLRLYPPGTLIIALYGQGKTRGQVAEIQIEATINQACAALVFIDSLEISKSYVKLVLTKQYAELRSLAAGGAQPNLNVGIIKNAIIPLPPLEEQKRIVAKVDQLMILCDQLEAKIKQAQSDNETLMEAAVNHLLTA